MKNWDEQTDVIVVGSGAAGLSAAHEARAAGASVMVFEKMKVVGGNTRISDSCLAAPGNYLQKSMGVADSPDLLYEDMLKAGLGLNHPPLVRLVAEKAAEAIDWTRSELGIEYQDRLDRFGGHSAARCLTTRNHIGIDIVKAQVAKLSEMGVEIRTRSAMTDLLTDAGGAVQGVRIRSGYEFPHEKSGTIKTIRARHAVILASGGYGNDMAFRTLQNPVLDESIDSTNHRGATAEGLIAALKVKAAPIHLSWIQSGPWGCADETGYGKGSSFASYSVYPFGILVDPVSGKRIVDEWSDRRTRCEAIFKAGHACVGIVDDRGGKKAADSLERCLKSGKVRGFENLAELAEAYKIPARELEKTVSEYNAMIKKESTDAFGKPLGKGALPLSEPPFYAVRLWPKVHYTPGGLAIDTHARVLDLHGNPIPGLFAAGEVCGGIHGASRLGSCALTECIVFGRIAGKSAAEAFSNPAGS